MKFAQNLRDKVASGKAVLGTFLVELKAPGVVQILANSGFDYLMIDGEHGNYSMDQICTLIAAAHAAMIPVLVRIPLNTQDVDNFKINFVSKSRKIDENYLVKCKGEVCTFSLN